MCCEPEVIVYLPGGAIIALAVFWMVMLPALMQVFVVQKDK